MQQLLLVFCILKKKVYILLMFQNKTEVVKNNFYRLIEKDGIVLQ